MSEATAILIAAGVAVGGYLINHGLGRWAERKRAEERAVTDLASAAMALQSMARFQRRFADGPLWRQLLTGSLPAMPKEVAMKLLERGFTKLDDVIRAQGELLQHARAELADAATEVLEASLAIGELGEQRDDDEVVRAAEYRLGQARLRLYRVSRGSRSRWWRLGRPRLFDNIDDPVRSR